MSENDQDVIFLAVPPLPPVEELAGRRCRRTYRYRFATVVPEEQRLHEIAAKLSHVIEGRSPTDEHARVSVDIALERRGPRELDVRVETESPEDSAVYITGLRWLPKELDALVGRIESMNGMPREEWWTAGRGFPP